MILILFSRINDLDHLIPIAYNLNKSRSDLEISFMPRTLHLNFDLHEVATFSLIESNHRINFLNIFEYAQLNFFYRSILNCYSKGIINKIQTKLLAMGAIHISFGDRFLNFLNKFDLVIIDHQARPKSIDIFNGIDNQILTNIQKKNIKVVSIPHSYWHLQNGEIDFKNQFSNMAWNIDFKVELISNSKNWSDALKNTISYDCLTLRSDRYSEGWYQKIISLSPKKIKINELNVVLFETGGSKYEKENNINPKWEELYLSLNDQDINFVLSGHTRSKRKRILGANYSNMSGFYDVLNSDIIITTYSSMAYDAFLLNKIIIWPKFLANPEWKSILDVYSHFYYVDTIDDCIELLRSLNSEGVNNSELPFNNELDNNHLISSYILESLN